MKFQLVHNTDRYTLYVWKGKRMFYVRDLSRKDLTQLSKIINNELLHQEPAEPKFKDGDIVLCCGRFYQVTEVKEHEGEFFYAVGGRFFIPEDDLTRPDNPTVINMVKDAFAILNNHQTINFD